MSERTRASIKSTLSLLLLGIVFFTSVFAVHGAFAQEETIPVHFFGRDDCGFCTKQKDFHETLLSGGVPVEIIYYNVTEDDAATELFSQVLEKHELPHVTPTTVIGERVMQGYDSPRAAGVRIRDAITAAGQSDIRTIEDHLERAPKAGEVINLGGCDEEGGACGIIAPEGQFIFDLPVIGVVDLEQYSLFALSSILGFIDGFNPCAMWVLVTFLLILSQVGDRKKMIYVAGLFILAEAIMYNLILNVWYQTWDFVGLDAIVTPLVGFVALGSGAFFLWRYHRNRGKDLTCDISDIEEQSKTQQRITKLVSQPLTWVTAFGIVAIAFSVNIIEFACSIGIPQAFTKILELNQLDFLGHQFYILIYTVFYMIDDLIVFGLAIWGFSKLHAMGHKYSQLSLLIGGLLMLLLGALLVLNPSLLVF